MRDLRVLFMTKTTEIYDSRNAADYTTKQTLKTIAF